MLKFTQDHEWLRVENGVATVGITKHAAEQLGDLVFVELPEPGTSVSKDEEIVTIESVKAASDITAPLDGEIAEVNAAIVETPALVNQDPMNAGWFFKIKLTDPSAADDLMDQDAYNSMVE